MVFNMHCLSSTDQLQRVTVVTASNSVFLKLLDAGGS